jgi:hypothetical protein
MASPEDLATLRQLINEFDDTNGWTDDYLNGLIDGGLTLNKAAGSVWTIKAGRFSALVDVTESGSSRKMSDLHKNALAMARYYSGADAAEAEETAPTGPVIQRIRRSFP